MVAFAVHARKTMKHTDKEMLNLPISTPYA